MADSNKLELVIEVDVNKANASIKNINSGLSSIEQAAAKSASGASRGIDGLTVSMVKGATAGNLLADAIKGAIDWVKQWTLEAAKMAAHQERLTLSSEALARANGVSADAMRKAVEQVKQVGFSSEDAMHAVNRLMIADMDIAKAQGLAKIAKDAAAIEHIEAPEALEKILQAIEFGNQRALRSSGLVVHFTEEIAAKEALLGRTLSENEKVQIRYNAVVQAAAAIQGAHAAAQNTAEVQAKNLSREVDELRKKLGAEFLDAMKGAITGLRELVAYAKDNSTWLAKVAEGMVGLGIAIATAAIAKKVWEMAAAVRGLTLALAANPIALAATATVLAGAVVYKTWSDTNVQWEKQAAEMKDKAVRQDLMSGRKSIAQLKQEGYTEDYLKGLVLGNKTLPGEKFEVGGPKVVKDNGPNVDAAKLAAEIRKRQADAAKSANDLLIKSLEELAAAEGQVAQKQIQDSLKVVESTQHEQTAVKESLTAIGLSFDEYLAGLRKIGEEEKKEIEARSSFVDEHGKLQRFALQPEVLEKIHQATAAKVAAFDLKWNQEETTRVEGMWKALADRHQKMVEQYVTGPLKQDLAIWEQAYDLDTQRKDKQLGYEKQGVDQRKNIALAELDRVDAVTIQQKVWVEQQKTAIEVQAIQERTRIELEEIDRRTQADIRAAQNAAMAKGIFDDERLNQIRSRISQMGDEEKDALRKAAGAEIGVTQIKGANDTRKIVVDQYRSIFDSLKQQAGNVFDALLSKSKSVWQALADTFKTAVLTAIKEIVSSRVAAMLMSMFVPGSNVAFAQGGAGGKVGGGILGALGGILPIGGVPVFGGGGGAGGGGLFGGATGNPYVFSAAPGVSTGSMQGVPGLLGLFTGPGGKLMTASGVPVGPTAGAGIGSRLMGALPGALAMTGGMFGIQGLQQHNPLMSMLGFGGMGAGIGMMAGQGAAWGGWLGAGIGLSALGLQRGGASGLAMTTGGGALVGMQLGGPIGAAIGAGVGFVAGLVRMFTKTATEKAIQKVKDVYKLKIDNDIAKQIVEIAKQKYGSNLDVAIMSNEVKQLLQLYAMATGQKFGVQVAPRPVSLTESGGSLYQNPIYENGQALSFPGPLAVFGGVGTDLIPTNPYAINANGGQNLSVTLTLDPSQTMQAFAGKTVQTIAANARVVGQSVLNAAKSNAGRLSLGATMLAPGEVTQ